MISRRNALLSLTISAFLLPVGLTSAHAQKSDEQAIKAAYATADGYYRKKDMTKLMAMLTPDVVYKPVGSAAMDRKQMNAVMQTQMSAIQSIDAFKTTITKLTISGKTAQAQTSMVMKGKMKDQQGKTHIITSTSTSHDTWSKTAQGWRVKQVEALTDKSLIDGKPLGQ